MAKEDSMNPARKFVKNTIALTISKFAMRAAGAVVGILIVRYLGKEQFGQYATAIAFTGTFGVFLEFGFNVGFVRSGSRDRSTIPWFYGNVILIKAILSLIVYALIMIAAKYAHYPPITMKLIAIFGIAVAISSFDSCFSGLIQIFEKMEIISAFEILKSVLTVILVLLVMGFNLGVIYLAYANLAIASLIFSSWFIFNFRFIKPEVYLTRIKKVFKDSYLFGLSALFWIIYYQIDIIMLSLMKDEGHVGIYSAAYKLITILFILPSIIIRVIMPVAFKLGATNREGLRKIYIAVTRYYSLVGIILMGFLLFLGSNIILFLYGLQFSESIPLIKIFAFVLFVKYLTDFNGNVLDSIDKVHYEVYILGITASFNVLINLILIPKYGVIGAGFATLLSEVLLGLLRIYFASKFFFSPMLGSLLMKPVIASFPFWLFLYFCHQIFPPYITIATALMIYIVTLYLVRFFTPGDFLFVKGVLGKVDASDVSHAPKKNLIT